MARTKLTGRVSTGGASTVPLGEAAAAALGAGQGAAPPHHPPPAAAPPPASPGGAPQPPASGGGAELPRSGNEAIDAASQAFARYLSQQHAQHQREKAELQAQLAAVQAECDRLTAIVSNGAAAALNAASQPASS